MTFINLLASFFYIFVIGPISIFKKIIKIFFFKEKKSFWKINKK